MAYCVAGTAVGPLRDCWSDDNDDSNNNADMMINDLVAVDFVPWYSCTNNRTSNVMRPLLPLHYKAREAAGGEPRSVLGRKLQCQCHPPVILHLD